MASQATLKRGAVQKNAAQHANQAVPARHGWHIGKLFVLGVGVVIVVAAALLLLNSSSSKGLQELPAFPNVGGAPAHSIAQVQSLGGLQATRALANLTLSHLENMSQFSVSYSGAVYAHGAGAESIIAFRSPLNLSYSKFGSEERFYVNLTGASVLGDVEAFYLNTTTGTYTCGNFNTSAVSVGNVNGVLFGSRAVGCAPGNTLAGVDMRRLAHFDFSQASQYGINFTYTGAYQSVYRGMNCTYISGTMAQVAYNGTKAGAGNFGMCISDQYYVPLSFAAIFYNGYGSFSFLMNETSISNTASQAQIESMPGSVT